MKSIILNNKLRFLNKFSNMRDVLTFSEVIKIIKFTF